MSYISAHSRSHGRIEIKICEDLIDLFLLLELNKLA